MNLVILLFFVLGNALSCFAGVVFPPCTSHTPPGTKCVLAIDEARPTQPDVGRQVVDEKVKEYGALTREKLEKLKLRKTAPLWIGPDGNYYLKDHHHTSLSFFEIGEKTVYAEVLENWTGRTTTDSLETQMKQFWEHITEEGDDFLIREDGTRTDPLDPNFPHHLKECGNNRYRSIATALIKAGTVKKIDVAYYEFKIANAIRKLVLALSNLNALGIKLDDDGFKSLMKSIIKSLTSQKGKSIFTQLECSLLLNTSKDNATADISD